MAIQAVFNLVLTIDSTDYSAEVTQADLTVDGETIDLLTFGSAGWMQRFAGARNYNLAVNFTQDDASSKLRWKLWQVMSTATRKIGFTLKESSASTSESNPLLSGTVLVNQAFFGGQAGQLKGRSITLAGDGALTVATS